MYNERKREPEPRPAVCLFCGWRGRPDHVVLPDEAGSPALLLSLKRCKTCGRQLVQLEEDKPVLVPQIVTAIRDAGMTASEVSALADALRDSPDASPRDLAERVPKASHVLTVASRVGKDWQPILIVILTVMLVYLGAVTYEATERSATEARQAGIQAHQDDERIEQVEESSQLKDEQIVEILRQIEQRLDTH